MRPFDDVTIIDFSQRLPGSYCSSILADMGAKVVWVERAGGYPETRTIFPGLMELISRNKRSMTLNLKSGESGEITGKLIRGADVVIEEFRPGVAARLGIGYEAVRRENPRIVYCSISGFGQEGPYRDRVGHDINYLSLAGMLSIPGQPDTPPSRPGVPVVDLASGMFAALAIMGALRKREREDKGEYIDVSMLDCMISWTSMRAGADLVYGKKNQNEHLSPLNNVYETKDGKQVALGLLEQNFWEAFCKAVSREELLRDDRFSTAKGRRTHAEELLLIMRQIVGTYTRAELEKLLDWRQVPYSPVLSLDEAVRTPHVEARSLIQEVEAGALGTIREVTFPAVFSGARMEIQGPPPAWGEHTEEILREAGYGEEDIASFKKKAII